MTSTYHTFHVLLMHYIRRRRVPLAEFAVPAIRQSRGRGPDGSLKRLLIYLDSCIALCGPGDSHPVTQCYTRKTM